MQSNEELTLINKADLAVSDLVSLGGYLYPEQLQQFIRIAIKEAVAIAMVHVTTMNGPELQLDKISSPARVLHPATEGEALGIAYRSKPTPDKIKLTTTEVMAEIHLDRSVLEDQIERAGFQQTVVQLMGERVRLDLEDVLLNGDTTSLDTFLATMNGMLTLASSNVVPCGSVGLSKAVLRDLFDALPEQFESQPNLQYWTNRKARSTYRSGLSDRVGGLSDAIILGGQSKEIGYDDIPLRKIPMFPNNLNPGAVCTDVLLHDPKNFVLAFQRQMTLDREWRPSQRVYAIIFTMRLAQNYKHEPMVAKATQVIGS